MKILIIGSKGFIGFHCTSFLTQDNDDVWESDILSDDKNLKYFMIDSKNPNFAAIFQAEQFDVCINCSGAASVPVSFINPLSDFYLNVVNVSTLLDSLHRYNPDCKFVNLSSAAVYGNPASLPVKENIALNPVSPYGWHKYQSEFLCKEYYALFGIQTINLRIFSVYGPGLKKQLFWDIFQKLKRDNIVELFGTGNETRDFIYIDDLTRAIKIVIDHANFNGEAINISSGIEISIKDAAYIFCNYFSNNFLIRFNHYIKEGDPLYWKADISKLLSYGFNKRYSIESGLEETAIWLKENG
jgi:dTDP-glucose 4,6-dehydratase/UDP-glucose 4-epimerase